MRIKDIKLYENPFESCGELKTFTELCESLFDHENSGHSRLRQNDLHI